MEIDDIATLRELLASGKSLSGARLEGLDLRPVEDALRASHDLRGLVVLGGVVSPELARHLTAAGAIVFPTDPAAPVDVYRSRLYSPDELYAHLGAGYAATPDARAYAWTQDAAAGEDRYVAVLRALHDDSVIDALDDVLQTLAADDVPVVGVMGGHAVRRGSADYAAAARLGRALARAGRTVVTGGGPGAMEAANLSAYAVASTDTELDTALAALGAVPSFVPDIGAWAQVALDVRRTMTPGRVSSLGIPTWFYGHEPPNVFCDGIAKLFSNALREDVLLERCSGGIVVLPGAAGTVQEIFQAVTRLYYAPAGPLPPLVLVGREQWTATVPVWPLLQALGPGRPMAEAVHLVDDVDQALGVLLG